MCGHCAPSVGPDQMFIALVWIACNAGVLLHVVQKPAGWVVPPRCGVCHYDLASLSPHALCPECGASPEERARTKAASIVRIQWKNATKLVPACVCFALAVFLGKYLLSLTKALHLASAYGYSLRTSVKLVIERADTIVGDDWIHLAFFTAFAPLTVHVRSPRVRWMICLLLFLVPWIAMSMSMR
jgi:hypothetical protein